MDKIVKLTKQEIGKAITYYIGHYKEQSSFFPFKIESTNEGINLPDEITFNLKFISKGTSGPVIHNI